MEQGRPAYFYACVDCLRKWVTSTPPEESTHKNEEGFNLVHCGECEEELLKLCRPNLCLA